MVDEAPEFETKEEFLEWAKTNWPPDSQICPKHWAPFALRELDGGLLLSVIYMTDLVFMDVELAKRAGGDPQLALRLAAPFCCHYGELTYTRVLAEVTAPEEWRMDCAMDPKPGGPNRRCKAVLHDVCRDLRFLDLNDRTWGQGNWIRCATCPPDASGAQPYHHKDAHDG